MLERIQTYLKTPVSTAPLAVFRVLFGVMMLGSIIRFWANGWIESIYIEPEYHFSYFGFEWVKPLGVYTYLIFIICALSALFVALGFKYRMAILTFFLSFTYIELMDKTTYLNHYYFISLMSFIMIWLPANRYFSVDTYFKPFKTYQKVPRWTIFSVQLMLAIVYFYAGLAKLNSDWLMEAMPLKIWLPSNQNLLLVGDFLTQDWFIYAMAFAGALYDLTIPFLLWTKKTRWIAYFFVVFFHVFTRILFPIGMFPYVMIFSTLIFFSAGFHQKIISVLRKGISILGIKREYSKEIRTFTYSDWSKKWIQYGFFLFFAIQLLFPFRCFLYPGEAFWNEQGFRFSWRVMLMEKAGYTAFIVKDSKTGKQVRVEPNQYLTAFQQKQMSFQPDFILEFAHFLGEEYKKKGFVNPQVYADSYVTLNGRTSKRFVNPEIDLTKEKLGYKPIKWLMPFEDNIYGL